MITEPGLRSALLVLGGANLGSTPPDADSMKAWGGVVLLICDGWSDDDLSAATIGHLSDANRGRFWPTPADLIAQHEKGAPSPESLDSRAWDTITGRLARYGLQEAALREHLDPEHLRALQRVGGSWDVSRASGATLAGLRRRFLDALGDERAAGGHLQLVGATDEGMDPELRRRLKWEREHGERTPVPPPLWREEGE